jgi:hypothetical protein
MIVCGLQGDDMALAHLNRIGHSLSCFARGRARLQGHHGRAALDFLGLVAGRACRLALHSCALPFAGTGPMIGNFSPRG